MYPELKLFFFNPKHEAMTKLFEYVVITTVIFFCGMVLGINYLVNLHLANLFIMVWVAFCCVKYTRLISTATLSSIYRDELISAVKGVGILCGMLVIMGYVALCCISPSTFQPTIHAKVTIGITTPICVIGSMYGGVYIAILAGVTKNH